ncbi:hypothetical protein ASPCADRAFT_210242 [Aspergillus carbonarius ITEM 5010]|uniref:Uncharacterized protein n=1 Tax=Aspergillus carbonarius (strain ITEM 5010) TaxID=602072 RepID=A0A1R3RD20_ASPC5|nr:hypothetical protein ASPCADRAFT_210242 [Aspergillus carbonarius ITEM 5010]
MPPADGGFQETGSWKVTKMADRPNWGGEQYGGSVGSGKFQWATVEGHTIGGNGSGMVE